MARVWDVSVVFFKRKYSKCGEFGYRERIPRQEDCFSRRIVADCKNYLRARRTYFFCRRIAYDVRDLRIFAHDLRSADNLLRFRDDLPVIGLELADKLFISLF